jgi:hypothetical protein
MMEWCADGQFCEAGLEVDGCEGSGYPPLCVPCGKDGEPCCKLTTPCEGDLECLDSGHVTSGLCSSCGGLREPPCPGRTLTDCFLSGTSAPLHAEWLQMIQNNSSSKGSSLFNCKQLYMKLLLSRVMQYRYETDLLNNQCVSVCSLRGQGTM